MEEKLSSEPWPIFYECPACHQEVEAVAGETAQLRPCPHCGEPFVVAAEDGSTHIPDEERERAERSREEELDGLRIRQLARIRRAAIRTQSYCMIAVVACIVAIIQLCIDAFHRIRAHEEIPKAIALLFFAIVLISPVIRFTKLAIKYRRESQNHDLPEPITPPDFSTLSDGSQQARNLEDIR